MDIQDVSSKAFLCVTQQTSAGSAMKLSPAQERICRVRRERSQRTRTRPSALAFNFFEHRAAALAHGRIVLILTHMGGVVPAAFTLLPVCLLHLDMDAAAAVARALLEPNRRDDEQIAQLVGIAQQQ